MFGQKLEIKYCLTSHVSKSYGNVWLWFGVVGRGETLEDPKYLRDLLPIECFVLTNYAIDLLLSSSIID